MNTKNDARGSGLGLGAALIGLAAAAVGALLVGKGSGKPVGATASGDAADSGAGSAPERQEAGSPPPAEADGPSGPTARAQPAPTGDEGHAAPDLAGDTVLDAAHRAPSAFRPDMDAPMTAAEREALRPATGPSPSLVSDEGTGFQPSRARE